MVTHEVRVYPSSFSLPQQEQLAWKIAEVAADQAPIDDDVAEMAINRVIDNAAVAIAAVNRHAVISARDMALGHLRPGGATVFGIPGGTRVSPEWAAWANGAAVRELDFHDTYLAADYAHPGDTIPAILAVGQTMGCTGAQLVRGIVTAYEIQIDLCRNISLHKHKIDHLAHLCPAQVAGIGAMLELPIEIIYQAVQQAVHVSFTTRQSRKGEISSWKAYAPAHVGKLAVEAIDRAMRGETSPSPIYEGEDSVIAWMLDGPDACYTVALPAHGESKRAILESYTKQHSAEVQAQAIIDLAFQMRDSIPSLEQVREIVLHTSYHTHHVIGTGANDPQKYSPDASRETLDHSVMYIFAVALIEGRWHHVESYRRERVTDPATVKLWQAIRTVEDPKWTAGYHHPDPLQRVYGARAEVILNDETRIVGELDRPHAHIAGSRPFDRPQYLAKFHSLTDDLVARAESDRFLDAAQRLGHLRSGELASIHISLDEGALVNSVLKGRPGIF
jgi:2-methylcitrate dehydratase